MIAQPHVMREPHQLLDHLDGLVVSLDQLSKDQDAAANEEGKAMRRWEEIVDAQMGALENDPDRKGAFPSKERVESQCRRTNRDEWLALKRAELKLAKLSRRAQNIRQEIGGLQSVLKTLGDEARAPRPSREPEGHTYGGRAA